MRIALIGSRWFGAEMLKLLLQRGDDLFVVAPSPDDRLAQAAAMAGVPHAIQKERRRVAAEDMPHAVDAIVAAHSHAFILAEVRANARRAAIGYHPSLLPRHRGIAAVEWTIRSRDPIAGGSVYHLADELDGGAIAAQDWCFVYIDDDAATLWRRALAPMGLRLLTEVVEHIDRHGHAPAHPQDTRAVTLAPSLKKAAALA